MEMVEEARFLFAVFFGIWFAGSDGDGAVSAEGGINRALEESFKVHMRESGKFSFPILEGM